MAQPIPLNLPHRDPRAELRSRLENAPVKHAEALLDSYELLQQLHEHGVFQLLRGVLGASDKLVETAVEAAKSEESIRAIDVYKRQALFDASGNMVAVREDIGRHNAVDKIVGWALLAGHLPLSRHVLLVSGRGGFEIAQKALAGGIPVLASVSAPSSLAVKLARELGLTLVCLLYTSRCV